jgi:hypothetical protein
LNKGCLKRLMLLDLIHLLLQIWPKLSLMLMQSTVHCIDYWDNFKPTNNTSPEILFSGKIYKVVQVEISNTTGEWVCITTKLLMGGMVLQLCLNFIIIQS